MSKLSYRSLKMRFSYQKKFRRAVIAVALVMLCGMGFGVYSLINIPFGYYPTLQMAFFMHQDRLGRMGEITFIYEDEYSVTVDHSRGTAHFSRKTEGGREYFRCIGWTTGGIPLNSDPESIAREQSALSLINPFTGRPLAERTLYRRIHRSPLHGISTDPNIFYLRINGQAPDYVGISNVRRAIPALGEEGDYTTVYFWYFADFDWSFADDEFGPEDIVITFDPH